MTILRRLHREERGIALMVALAATLVLGIAVTAIITYTTANQKSTALSLAEQSADQIAEAGMEQAYSVLNNTVATNGVVTSPTLLGCPKDGTDTTKSNCNGATGTVFCITAASGCATGTAGAATVWGCFTPGTATCTLPDGTTYTGTDPNSSTWVVWSTGYARNPSGKTSVVSHTLRAKVSVSTSLTADSVASVWNHVFITSPLVPNVCALDFGGHGTTQINVPLYVIGNLCLGTTVIQEIPGGQAIDLQVGGQLYMTTGTVGASASSPITSGDVVGGCTTTGLTSGSPKLPPCDGTSPAFNYWVGTKRPFVQNDAPIETQADMYKDWQTFDPGPLNPCAAGTSPAPPSVSLDANTAGTNEPDASNTQTFDLTPSSSYACISPHGTGTGYLIWNASGSTITVSGISVPSHQLAIKGSIFIDGNVTASNSAVYSGIAVVEFSGSFSMPGNNVQICGVSGGSSTCPLNWQGSSNNTSMLTLASLSSNNPNAIKISGNSDWFQGSLWTQTSSSLYANSNSVTLDGPISVGSFSSSMNNTTLMPLPAIQKMPPGAPVPPNAGVQLGGITYTST